jgi:hypothetical protein
VRSGVHGEAIQVRHEGKGKAQKRHYKRGPDSTGK